MTDVNVMQCINIFTNLCQATTCHDKLDPSSRPHIYSKAKQSTLLESLLPPHSRSDFEPSVQTLIRCNCLLFFVLYSVKLCLVPLSKVKQLILFNQRNCTWYRLWRSKALYSNGCRAGELQAIGFMCRSRVLATFI